MLPGVKAPVPLESPPCPLCGGTDYRTVLEGARDAIWRKPGVFRLQRCAGCGLVATRPRPTPEALSFYYEGTYSGEGEDAMRRFQTESRLGRLISRYRLRVIEKVRRLGPDDRLLDAELAHAVRRAGGAGAGGAVPRVRMAESSAAPTHRARRPSDGDRPQGGARRRGVMA